MPEIYLNWGGKQTGPYQLAEIRQLLAEGKISGETLAWYEELTEWSTVAQVLAHFPVGEPLLTAILPPSAFSPPESEKGAKNGCLTGILGLGTRFTISFIVIVILIIWVTKTIFNGTTANRMQKDAFLQQAQEIASAMSQYADAHNGAYPDGRTSTEVFQKLLDGHYVFDPAVFFTYLPGKTAPTSHTLTADNVCFDVTSGLTKNSPGDVPVVFTTGYTVAYLPGGSASKDIGFDFALSQGIAVVYKNNRATFLQANAFGAVPNFISRWFRPGREIYLQLRP
ncbi:MAG TPA: DUF4339 domain-containing protein [Candidatus Methylacidiphilales bacterium]|nr:DUF4339 domain-containing protein [Candidatus Methylacidiphilales bacterium]